MQYTSSSSITVRYAIPAAQAAKSTQGKFHIEVQQGGSSNSKQLYQATAITAAVAPTAQNPTGTDGLVTFGSVALTDDGAYRVRVCYSSDADLDVAGVTSESLRTVTFIKVTPSAIVNL